MHCSLKFHHVLGLLWEDRQLNVDAAGFTVRPPAAPTTDHNEMTLQGPFCE